MTLAKAVLIIDETFRIKGMNKVQFQEAVLACLLGANMDKQDAHILAFSPQTLVFWKEKQND